VDAAHSFALLDYQIPDLGADYLGTSLHKWLCGPFGSGMLYVKKEKIPTLWPLLSSDDPRGPNITKFESLGTRSFPIEVAIGYSLDFHNLIGTARKQKRLHFLKNYWMDRLRDVPGIRFYTSDKPEYGCAIGTMGLDQLPAQKIGEQLQQQWRVHVVSIEREYIKCIRVTPNVYTTTDDLDKFIYGIRTLAKS
jgi:selenocysteine lyase/cysteine desulfurase